MMPDVAVFPSNNYDLRGMNAGGRVGGIHDQDTDQGE